MYNRSDKNGKPVTDFVETLKKNLQRLSGPEFRPFLQHLEEQLQNRTETLQSADDIKVVYRMQGQCKVLKEILGDVASAAKK